MGEDSDEGEIPILLGGMGWDGGLGDFRIRSRERTRTCLVLMD